MTDLLPLPAPYEILDLPDKGVATFHIRSAKEGLVTFNIRATGQPKLLRALRVLTAPTDKTMGPPYWDITSTLLIEQIRPHLTRPDLAKTVFKVTKFGVAPAARFSLETSPG